MKEDIERIKTKFEKLKEKDRNFKTFGSGSHKYKLNPVLSSEEVEQFENIYDIILPDEYKTFILNFGNGGA